MELKEKCKRHASSALSRAIRCKIKESQNIELTEVENSPESTSKATISGSKNLAKIVGDPFAAEKTWMAACTVAGSQSLAKKKAEERGSWWVFATCISAVTGAISAMMLFPITFLFAGHISASLTGADLDAFMRSTSTAQMLGFYFGLMGNAAFWTSALVPQKSWCRKGTAVLIAIFSTLLLIGVVSNASITSGCAAILGPIALAICLLCDKMGSQFRASLPKSVSVSKLMRSTFGGLVVPALMTATAICVVLAAPSGGHHSSEPYSPATPSAFGFYSMVLVYMATVSGYFMARCTNSKSRSGCAFLALVTQSPLLLGIGLTCIASLCGLFGLIPNDPAIPNGLWSPLSHIASLGIVAALTVAGGVLGANCNRFENAFRAGKNCK